MCACACVRVHMRVVRLVCLRLSLSLSLSLPTQPPTHTVPRAGICRYALGITVIQALSLSDDVLKKAMLCHMLHMPIMTQGLVPAGVPGPLSDALVRCLATSPHERPTALQLMEAFSAAIGEARPSTRANALNNTNTLVEGEAARHIKCTSGSITVRHHNIIRSAHSFSSFTVLRPVKSGTWYFEVLLKNIAGIAQIGWADVEFRGSSRGGAGVGDDSHSWGTYSSNRRHGPWGTVVVGDGRVVAPCFCRWSHVNLMIGQIYTNATASTHTSSHTRTHTPSLTLQPSHLHTHALAHAHAHTLTHAHTLSLSLSLTVIGC